MPTQQTQNSCRPLLFVQCWNNVGDVGPALYKYYTNVLCLLGNHIGPALAVMGILTNLLCPSRYASQLASDPAKGGHGVISIYGRAVNKDARCLNTMSIFEVKREILKFDVFEADLLSDSIFLGLTFDNRLPNIIKIV